MRSGFQRDPTPRNLAEHLLDSFQCRGQFLFQDYFTRFVQDAVTAGSISQIQTDRQLVILENLDPLNRHSANLLHCRSPFCASSASFIGSVSHPAGRPAFSSHLISRVTGKVKLSEIHLDGKGVNQELTVDSTDMALPA